MFQKMSQVSVESIDDKEDMGFADEAFDILGFSKEEKYNVYKVSLFFGPPRDSFPLLPKAEK